MARSTKYLCVIDSDYEKRQNDRMQGYPFPDPFDSVITATATIMDLPLLTKDAEITASQLADIYW